MTVAPTPIQSAHEHHRYRWLLVLILVLGAAAVAVGLLFQFDVFGGSSSSTNPKNIVQGSGVPATQTRDVAAFHSVELAGANNVVIHAGEKQSVVVTADDNLLNRVTTKVKSGTLVIGNTPGSLTTNSPMSVEVTAPTLNALTLTGSGNIVVNGVKADNLTVALSGSGNVTGSGSATSLGVTLDGSGNAWFTRVAANHVHAVLSGSGNIFVTATKSLDASIPGSGAILYSGNPASVTKSVTGSGAITAR